MFQDSTSLAAMAEALSRSTDYRVLRRLVPRMAFTPSVGQSTKTGILLDTETTIPLIDLLLHLSCPRGVVFAALATAGEREDRG
jgi:hypothetical protein